MIYLHYDDDVSWAAAGQPGPALRGLGLIDDPGLPGPGQAQLEDAESESLSVGLSPARLDSMSDQ